MKSVSHPRLVLVSILVMSLLVAPQVLGLIPFGTPFPAAPVFARADHLEGQTKQSEPEDTVLYIVQPGDTLNSIALRFSTTVAAIVAANGIVNPNFIWVGQRLIIPLPSTPPPECQVTHTVQRGETLSSISRRYGTTPGAIAAVNGLTNPNFIWVGQRLTIPVCDAMPTATVSPTPSDPTPTISPTLTYPTPTPTSTPTPSCEVIHTVQSGETLSSIARRFGTTVASIIAANSIVNPDFIWVGQRLVIPVCDLPALTVTPSPSADKWIDVNLSTQTLLAYQGSTPVLQTLISSGTIQHPSPVGTYYVYLKLISQDMSGPGYYLPDVPYVMYFYSGYAIHGTYWHSNFGQPMSHGCINLPIPEAGWIYEWALMGTPVVLHY